jgi:tetratricopeptide (TPR) repeat protein
MFRSVAAAALASRREGANLLRALLIPPLILLLTAFVLGQAGDVERERVPSSPDPLTLGALLDPTLQFELEESLRSRDYEKAQRLLVNEIETNPRAPKFQLLTYLGGLFFVDGKYLNAAIAYKRADAMEPIDDGNRFTLALSYVLLGRRDWARPELEALERTNPGDVLYSYWLGRLDYDDNNYQLAVERFHALLERHPTYVRALDRLALCYEALGRNEEALEYFTKAIEITESESSPWAWPALNLGTLLIQMGEAEGAEGYLRRAIRIDPKFAQAHYRLGIALEKLERFEESAESLQRAASLDPEYPDPHWALARVLRRSGDRDGAARAVARYRELKDAENR